MIWTWFVPGVVLLGLVIFVHELGHFLVAKWRGVRVLKFSLGFGPAIVQWTHGETQYRLSWIPLGGYVQMAGDSPAEDGTMPNRPDEFLSHPGFGRLLIAAAGPAANLVTAFLVMVLVGMTGVRYPDYPNLLGAVPDTSLAYHMGLRPGDRITQVADTPVSSWIPIFVTAARVPEKEPLAVTVTRKDTSFTLHLSSEEREPLLSSLRRPSDPPVVGGVVTGMPAYKAGLKEGDRILAVDGQAVKAWDELPPLLDSRADRPVRLTILREHRAFDLSVTPMNPDGRPGGRGAMIGIEPPRRESYIERHNPLESIDLGARATVALVANVYGGMWLTVSRPLYYLEYLGGPLFIAQAASERAKRAASILSQFLAMINVAAWPSICSPSGLDGGHITLALLEAFRQAISARAYGRFQKVGLAVIRTLFILILANDPLRLVQRQRALGKAPSEAPVAPSPP